MFSPLTLILVKIVSEILHQLTQDILLPFRQTERSRFETLALYHLFSQSISLITLNNLSISVHYCIIHRSKEESVPFHDVTTLTAPTLHLPPQSSPTTDTAPTYRKTASTPSSSPEFEVLQEYTFDKTVLDRSTLPNVYHCELTTCRCFLLLC